MQQWRFVTATPGAPGVPAIQCLRRPCNPATLHSASHGPLVMHCHIFADSDCGPTETSPVDGLLRLVKSRRTPVCMVNRIPQDTGFFLNNPIGRSRDLLQIHPVRNIRMIFL